MLKTIKLHGVTVPHPDTRGSCYDPEITAKTLARQKELGIGVPLGDSLSDMPEDHPFRKIMIRPDGTDPMDAHPEWTGRTRKPRKRRALRYPDAQPRKAFMRALDRNGWSLLDPTGNLTDHVDAESARLASWRISFLIKEWILYFEDEERARHPYPGGSMRKLRQATRT